MDWFNDATSTFSDATIYLGMALLGTGVFVIRLAMMLIFGLDDGMDVHGDVGGDVGDHDTGFGLFSILSVTSFMMAAGWIGLVCRVQYEMGGMLSALAAFGTGFGMMLFSAGGMHYMKRFQQVGGYDPRTCIGKLGRVYLSIPKRGEGEGQVQMNVDGRQKVLAAVSTGEKIESFATVKVLDVQGEETLVVERHTHEGLAQ